MGDGANRVRTGASGRNLSLFFVFSRTAVVAKPKVCDRVWARQAVHTQREGGPRRTARRRDGCIVNISVLPREYRPFGVFPSLHRAVLAAAGECLGVLMLLMLLICSLSLRLFLQRKLKAAAKRSRFAFRTSFSSTLTTVSKTKVVYDFDDLR